MPGKPRTASRVSHSTTAFRGSGGVSGDSKLIKYTSPKTQRLEDIVSNSYGSIENKLKERAKITLKYFMPELYHGLLIAKFLYKHRRVIIQTIENVAQIWSEGTTPVSDRVITTTIEIIKGGVDIAKVELKERIVSYIASEFSKEAVILLEKKGVVDTVAKVVTLEDHKDRFSSLLEDTIEQQTKKMLESIMERR